MKSCPSLQFCKFYSMLSCFPYLCLDFFFFQWLVCPTFCIHPVGLMFDAITVLDHYKLKQLNFQFKTLHMDLNYTAKPGSLQLLIQRHHTLIVFWLLLRGTKIRGLKRKSKAQITHVPCCGENILYMSYDLLYVYTSWNLAKSLVYATCCHCCNNTSQP